MHLGSRRPAHYSFDHPYTASSVAGPPSASRYPVVPCSTERRLRHSGIRKIAQSRNFVIQRTRRNRIITRQGRQVFTIDLLNADTRMFPADRTAQIEEWFLIWQRIDQSRQQISTTDILFIVSSHRNIRTRIPRSGGIAIDSPTCPSGTAPSISSFSGSSSITGVAGIIISTAGKTAPPK